MNASTITVFGLALLFTASCGGSEEEERAPALRPAAGPDRVVSCARLHEGDVSVGPGETMLVGGTAAECAIAGQECTLDGPAHLAEGCDAGSGPVVLALCAPSNQWQRRCRADVASPGEAGLEDRGGDAHDASVAD